MHVDLNADLGEGAGRDAELLELVTSANVCGGLHAGTAPGIADTIRAAHARGVVVGAHPGFADRAHFGRVEQSVSPDDVRALVLYQLGALSALAGGVKYVKPHGALYHQTNRDAALAGALIDAARHFGALPIVGLPNSALESACRARAHPFVREGYADRRYRADGTLVPRSEPDAFVHDAGEAVAQVEELIRAHAVRTVCVHGDNPEAVAFTRAVRAALLAGGFELRAFS
jgi:5-oxoprolinase (ATP-hydrolysing) subunit A